MPQGEGPRLAHDRGAGSWDVRVVLIDCPVAARRKVGRAHVLTIQKLWLAQEVAVGGAMGTWEDL